MFTDVAASFAAQGVPVSSYQLDPYWFSAGSPGNANWSASEEIWGAGGAGFLDCVAAGMRFTLYSFFWAVKNTFTQFRWVSAAPARHLATSVVSASSMRLQLRYDYPPA